ncbi:MAG: primosomal protein N', partial [Bacteroidota bacterium]
VVDIQAKAPEHYRAKPIISIIDPHPIIFPEQFRLWQWIASYYCCTIGEVMNAALPAGLKLASETTIVLSPIYDPNFQGLSDKEFIITESLNHQQELSIDDIRKILNQKTVYPLIHRLLNKKVIYLKEELVTKYKPKKVICVRFQEPYFSNPDYLEAAFEKVNRASRQVESLMAFIELSRKQQHVRRTDLCKKAQVDTSVLHAIVKKEIFEYYDHQISRIAPYAHETVESFELTEQQTQALSELRAQFMQKNVALLHGVTGSGKTRVYIELIKEAISRGEQVLYLLPEIALTAQIVVRLQKIFGDDIAVYHSRLNNHERVEMWQQVLKGIPIILGVRSSLFLPFQHLSLVIVDEEHDTSFKQYDPAPRYNARDTAIYLAHLHQARVLLGTATPGIESYFNTKQNKYGLVEMKERFGGLQLPEIVVVDAKEEFKKRKLQSHFTSVLLAELEAALDREEQAILFQNRRGYAPSLFCQSCGWTQECQNCDVSLTFHKFTNNLRCHYCGFQAKIPNACPACGEHQLNLRGFGTEKIEDELKIYLPNARIGRMDFDTVKGKHAHATIINDFEERRLDILVGTQMVTKGLDFDNVGIVGILSADHLLRFPDFRSTERAFQLMTQVSGRAGRKRKRGKVIIQAFNIAHPVIREVRNNDFTSFYRRELEERQTFQYPPYTRLIEITLKHKKPDLLNDAARFFTQLLKSKMGKRVLGPAIPGVPRVRGQYLLTILVKMERQPQQIRLAKNIILEAGRATQSRKGCSALRVNIDVDPQ